MWVILVAFSVCVHEVAHVWMAMREGDMTAYREGYFTLNPLKVMGPQSLIALVICGFAWGAVPVNRSALRRRNSALLVSMAGPGSNLSLAVVFCFGTAIALRTAASISNPFVMMLNIGLQCNLFLFFLNMMPVPFLDGWAFYKWVFPGLKSLPQETKNAVGLVVFLVIFFGPGRVVISRLVNTMSRAMLVAVTGAMGM